MVMAPPFMPFQIGEDWMIDFGWAVLALVGVYTLSLYIWSYVNKNIEEWKAQEGRYLDSEVLDFARWMVRIFIVMFLVITTFLATAYILDWTSLQAFRDNVRYVFHAMFAIIILLVAILIVKVLRRVSRRARIKISNGAVAPTTVEITSLFLSYLVYIVAFIAILVIILWDIWGNPAAAIYSFLQENNAQIAVTLAIIVGIFFIMKLAQTILEDYKFRSRKFNPHVLDLLESGIRYALLIIGFLVVTFNIFMMFDMEIVGILLVVVTLVFIILGITLSYSTIQNIVSGIALMDTSPFDVGDRVRILGTMMCDVIEKGLIFTKVRTMDGEIVNVPNAELIQERIYNYSVAPNHAINVSFEVSFEVPHERVEEMVREVLSEIEGVLREPRPILRATEFRGGHIVYVVAAFSKDAQSDDRIRSEIIFRIQEVFQAEGHQTSVC